MSDTYDDIAAELKVLARKMRHIGRDAFGESRFGPEADKERWEIYERLRDVTDRLGACVFHPVTREVVGANKSYGREIENLTLALVLAFKSLRADAIRRLLQ